MHSNSALSHSRDQSNASIQTTVNMPSPQKSASRVSSGVADLGLAAAGRLNQSIDKQFLSETDRSLVDKGYADRRVNDTYRQTTGRNARQAGNNAERRLEETDIDSVGVSNHGIGRQGKHFELSFMVLIFAK